MATFEQINRRRLAYFGILFALTMYCEQLAFYQGFALPTNIFESAAIVAFLCRPDSIGRLLLLCVMTLFHLFFFVNSNYNNIVLESLIAFDVLVVGAVCFWQNKDIYSTLAPILRISLIGLYCFAFLSKLNTGFLNPKVSCAAHLVDSIRTFYFPSEDWRPVLPFLKQLAVWGTVLSEGMLPILLFFRRTRPWAICWGIAFHFLLGIAVDEPIFTFSMLLLVFYFFFLSEQAFGKMQLWGEALKHWGNSLISTPSARYVVAALVVYVPQFINYTSIHNNVFWIWIWFVVYTTIGVSFIAATCSTSPGGLTNVFYVRPAFLLVLVLPVVFNGMSPYVGLKTTGTMGMYSNLRVWPPHRNHLFLPASMIVFPQEWVKITDSDDSAFAWYAQEHYLIAAFEFRRLINMRPGSFFVTFVYKGRPMTIIKSPGPNNGHPLLKPIPWWEQKLIHFKPVKESGEDYCPGDTI